MGGQRSDSWEEDSEVYSESQIESVLEFCDIEIVSDTSTNFLCYCPFHGNTDTPAFSISKSSGAWSCFNPSCFDFGDLTDLVRRVKKITPFAAMRAIIKFRHEHSTPFSDRIAAVMEKPVEFVEFPQENIDRMVAAFPGSVAEDYMLSRGMEKDTLRYFEVGYSEARGLVTVPMHDPKGMPVGVIGRTPSHTDKTFKNSVGLPKSKTMWNFHRAKKYGDTLIICEASYDAMRIYQAGYPNVCALLGGHLTDHHVQQIQRHFARVIIMTDFDPKQYRPNCRVCDYKKCVGHRPGRDLGRTLVKRLPTTKMMWGAYDDTCVFPHGAKDASDMTDDEIRQCLREAVSNLTYSQWNIEERVAA